MVARPRPGQRGQNMGSRCRRLGFELVLALAAALPPRVNCQEDRPLIRIAGSGTVYHVALAWVEAMQLNYTIVDHSGNNTVCEGDSTVCAGGSSTGAARVCADRSDPDHVDIGAMSRDWKDSEAEFLDDDYTLECMDTGVRVTQLVIGIDGLAIIVSDGGSASECLVAMGGLTLAQLRWIFSDWSDDQLENNYNGGVHIASVAPNLDDNGIKEWSDFNAECDKVPINPYGPGKNSGTGAYFGEEVFCKNCYNQEEGYAAEDFPYCDADLNSELEEISAADGDLAQFMADSRPSNCYMASTTDDYDMVTEWVTGDAGGIAFFGFGYFSQNSGSLTIVRIAADAVYGVQDTSDALVAPSTYTIVDGSYSVFTRYLYMNVDNEAWELVQPLMTYGFSDGGMAAVSDFGFININSALRARMVARTVEGGNPTADYVPVAPDSCEIGTELISSPYYNDYGVAKVAYECRPCEVGYFKADTSASSCTACVEGTYTNTSGRSICSFCPSGSYAHEGSSDCTTCPVNTAAPNPGMGACASCDEGLYTDGEGAHSCSRCPIGSYRNSNLTTCNSCPSLMTTEYLGATQLSECACAAGLFLAEGGTSQGPCATCPAGMTCAFGSAYANFDRMDDEEEGATFHIPLVDEQYWTPADEPLSVYRCKSDYDICPGGKPGQCAGGRIGLVCSHCPDGQTWNGDDNICEECAAGYKFMLYLAVLVVTALILSAYYFGNSAPSANVTIATAMGTLASQLLTITQILSMFGDLNVTWPETVRGWFRIFSLSLGSRSVGFECFLGNAAVKLYSFRCIMPPFFMFELSVVYLLSKVIVRLAKLFLAEKWHEKFEAWSWDGTINTAGQLLQGLFIGVAAITVVPLQCYRHPNGLASMTQYPQVLCWSFGDHTILLILAILIAVMFVIPFIAWCLHGTYVVITPTGLGKIARYRFLLFRFRADVWWWGDVYLLRQLILAFAPSLPAESPQGQSIYVVITLVMYGFAQAKFWPWKAPEFNLLDMFTTAGLVVVIIATMALMPSTSDSRVYEGILFASVAMLAFGSMSLVLLILYFLPRMNDNKSSFGFDRKALSEALTERLFKTTQTISTYGFEHFVEALDQMSYYDRIALVKGIDAYTSSNPIQGEDMLSSTSSRLLGLKRTDFSELVQQRRGSSKESTGQAPRRLGSADPGFCWGPPSPRLHECSGQPALGSKEEQTLYNTCAPRNSQSFRPSNGSGGGELARRASSSSSSSNNNNNNSNCNNNNNNIGTHRSMTLRASGSSGSNNSSSNNNNNNNSNTFSNNLSNNSDNSNVAGGVEIGSHDSYSEGIIRIAII